MHLREVLTNIKQPSIELRARRVLDESCSPTEDCLIFYVCSTDAVSIDLSSLAT